MEQIEIETKGHRALVEDHCRLNARVDALTELMTALAATTAALDARMTKIERIYREMLEDHVTLMHQTEACEERLEEVGRLMSQELTKNFLRNLPPVPCEPPNGSAATLDPYSPAVFDNNPLAVKPIGGVTADSWLPADADWVTDFAAVSDGK